jgi:endonuclease/exonuclease/phosphatase family metal-dependent hydrolase
MKILTYNVRYDNPHDGINAWENRKNAVIALIKETGAEIFCVQECLKNQKDDLEQAFPTFGLVGVGRADGWLKGEMVNIFYNTERFKRIFNGDFWLSETPHVIGSLSWGSALPRVVSWVKLYDKKTDNSFFVFNTHFDHISDLARENSALLLHQKVKELAGEHTAFITGDFNLTPKDATYKLLTNQFMDIKTLSPTSPKQNTTFNNFGKTGVSGHWIDYIFTNYPQNVTVKAFEIIETKMNQRFPSDHFPILVEVDF